MMFDSPPWLELPEFPPVKMGIAMPIIPTPKIYVVDGESQAFPLLYPILDIACILLDVENMLTKLSTIPPFKDIFLSKNGIKSATPTKSEFGRKNATVYILSFLRSGGEIIS